ncbi:MAG: hypothetical protein ACK4GW_00740 [Pseudorhodobacter sp.]
MSVKFAAPLALIALVSCSGNPFNPAPPAPPPEEIPNVPPPSEIGVDIPKEEIKVSAPPIVAQHLRSAAYDRAAGTLKINLASLDGSPVAADYVRDNTLDLSGYQAFTLQEANTQRKFLALVKTSDSGVVTGATVADGGQFQTYFGGGQYYRVDGFTMPTTGLASYTGSYVGVLNSGEIVPGGVGGDLDARLSDRITGRILLNADFNETNLEVSGGIDNRMAVRTNTPLDSVVLWTAPITSDGAFAGTVRNPSNASVGNYGGIFAGTNASDVAGALVFRPLPGDTATIEHGLFVLPRCTGPADQLCP